MAEAAPVAAPPAGPVSILSPPRGTAGRPARAHGHSRSRVSIDATAVFASSGAAGTAAAAAAAIASPATVPVAASVAPSAAHSRAPSQCAAASTLLAPSLLRAGSNASFASAIRGAAPSASASSRASGLSTAVGVVVGGGGAHAAASRSVVSSASKRSLSHLVEVHSTLLAANLAPDEALKAAELAEAAARDSTNASASAAHGARLKIADETAPSRGPVNPYADLPGMKLMAAAKAFTNFSDNTSAALLSVPLPARSNAMAIHGGSKLSKALAAEAARKAARSALPSVEELVERQEAVRARLQQRWAQAAAELEQAERDEREAQNMQQGLGSGSGSGSHDRDGREEEEKESSSASTSAAGSKITSPVQASRSMRGSKRGSQSGAGNALSAAAASGSKAQSRPLSAAAREGHAAAAASSTAAASSDAVQLSPVPASAPDGSLLLTDGSGAPPVESSSSDDDDDDRAGERLSRSGEPRVGWSRHAERSASFRAWMKAELRSLSNTAYDQYLADQALKLQQERERREGGPGLQFTTAAVAAGAAAGGKAGAPGSKLANGMAPTTVVVPNALVERELRVRASWANRYPPVLQPRWQDGPQPGSGDGADDDEQLHATSKRGKAPYNPVLVPVLERRLMDLSKPLREVMKQIEREERGEAAKLFGGGGGFSSGNHGSKKHAGAAGASGGAGGAADDDSSFEDLAHLHRKDGRPSSPRSAYNAQQSLTLQNLVALLMQLDEQVLQAIRAEFSTMDSSGAAKGKGLLIYDFVVMACTHIGMAGANAEKERARAAAASAAAVAAVTDTDKAAVAAGDSTALVPASTTVIAAPEQSVASDTDMQSLLDMFREIDVNSDALMEFDEFTSHLVQLASTYGADSAQSATAGPSMAQPHFIHVSTPSCEDQSLHSRPCEIVKFFGGSGVPGTPGVHKLVLLERNSRLLKIYNPELQLLKTLRCRAPILAVEYLPPRHQVVVSCADRSLQFFSVRKSATYWELECTWQLGASQTCLEYAGKSGMGGGGGESNGGSNHGTSGMKHRKGLSSGSYPSGGGGSKQSRGAAIDASTSSSPSLNFNLLYTGDTNGRITCWNLDRGEEKFRIEAAHHDVIMEIVLLSASSLAGHASRGGADSSRSGGGGGGGGSSAGNNAGAGLLVSCGLDSLIKVWDCSKASIVAVLAGHSKAPLHLAWHPELRLLVSGGLDRFALVWGLADAVSAAAAAAAHSHASSSSSSSSLTAYTVAPIMKLPTQSPLAHVVGIEVLAGSPEVVVGDSHGCFGVFDLRSGTVVQSFSAPRQHGRGGGGNYPGGASNQSLNVGATNVPHGATAINGICVVPALGLLVAAGPKLFSFRRTTGVLGHRADDEPVSLCVFDPQSLQFVSAASNSLKVWNALTGAMVREEKGFIEASAAMGPAHTGEPHQKKRQALNPAAGGEDDDNPAPLSPQKAVGALSAFAIAAANATITAMCLDDRVRRAYIGLSSGAILCLNTHTGAILARIQPSPSATTRAASAGPNKSARALGASNEISALLYHSSTKQVISGSWDGCVCWMDDLLAIVSRKSHAKDAQHKDIVALVAAPEYKIVASASADSSVVLYDERQGPMLLKWTLPAPPTCAVFLSPYPLLLVADQSGGISIFDSSPPFAKGALCYLGDISIMPVTRPVTPAAAEAHPRSSASLQALLSGESPPNRSLNGSPSLLEVPTLSTGGSSTMATLSFAHASARGSPAESARSSPRPGGRSLKTPQPAGPVAPHPAILSLRFDAVHRWLLLGDDMGYVKVVPLGFSLLRKFHASEIAAPTTLFNKRIFKPTFQHDSVIIRAGWALPPTAPQPRELEVLNAPPAPTVDAEQQCMAEKLSHVRSASSAGPPGAAGAATAGHHGHTLSVAPQAGLLGSPATPGHRHTPSASPAALKKMGTGGPNHASSPSMHNASAGAAAAGTAGGHGSSMSISITAANAAAVTAGGSTPTVAPTAVQPPPVLYAPSSLVFPPAPTRASINGSLIKDWTMEDSAHAQAFTHPSLQIQAHADACHGVSLISDTLHSVCLLSWSFEGTVRLWNADTGDRVGELMQGHNARTPQRDERWEFHYDIAKHKLREQKFAEEAFRRPLSPEPEEDEAEAQARLLLALKPPPITVRMPRRVSTGFRQAPVEEFDPAEFAPSDAAPNDAAADGGGAGLDQPDGSAAGDDGSGADDDDAGGGGGIDVDLDAAVRQTKRRDAKLAHHAVRSSSSASSPDKKGDTFLTDLDGPSASASDKKKQRKLAAMKRRKAKEKAAAEAAALASPTAALDAAAKIAAAGGVKSRTASASRQSISVESGGAGGSYSTVVSPEASPAPSSRGPGAQQRGMVYSQSQPVFSGVGGQGGASAATAAPSTPSGPRDYHPQLAAIPGSPSSSTLRSGPNSPGMFGSAGGFYGSSPASAPTQPSIPLPQRTAAWRGMPGASSLHSRSIAAVFGAPSRAPPPPSAPSALMARSASATTLSPLQRLLAGAAEEKTGGAMAKSASASHLDASSSPVGGVTPQGGGRVRVPLVSHDALPPALFAVSSRALPRLRKAGAPLLGADRKAAAAAAAADGDDSDESARGGGGSGGAGDSAGSSSAPAARSHVLQLAAVGNRKHFGGETAVALTASQAATAARLGLSVSASQRLLHASPDRGMSVRYLEKQHRKHKEQISEFM